MSGGDRQGRLVVCRFVRSPLVAVAVTIPLIVAGSAFATATRDTAGHVLGAVVSGLATAGGGCWVGTTIRLSRRGRRHG